MSKKPKPPPLIGLGYNLPHTGEPVRIEIGDMFFHECCKCQQRHLVSIERSPHGKGEVVMRWWRDGNGTDALRKAEGITVRKKRRTH